MEAIEKLQKNCYQFSFNSIEYVIKWTDNQTEDRVIEIAPYAKFPHLFYKELNSTHYQWCGPYLLIVEYFAKISKVK